MDKIIKNSFKPLLPILLIFVSTLVSFAQTDSVHIKLSSFVKNIHTFNNLYPQEKVYLHFDNTGYFLGDTIWFKAYVATAPEHKLSPLSRILYVELLTPTGKIIDRRKLKIENGQGNDEFALPRTMHAGYYEIRAYTRYMLNFGDETLFSRVFPVGNYEDEKEIKEKNWEKIDDRSPFYDKTRLPRKKAEKVNLNFYPEGGNMIAGLPTRVAFKATDEEGRSINVFGKIRNADGNETGSLQTVHKGMGVFELTPSDKEHIVIVDYNKKKYEFRLPAGFREGYGMNILENDSTGLKVLLQKSSGAPSDQMGLAVTCRGEACMFNAFSLTDEAMSIVIPTDSLPEGVNRLSLFDAKGEIYADRLFFVRHDEQAQCRVIITEDHNDLEKVKMQLQILDEQGQPAEAFFSVAVRDSASSPSNPYLDNLRTNLLLGSEVKGYIENPGWYFEKKNAQRMQALDLLLLTQGWRRYSWQKAAGVEPFIQKHYTEKEILVKGRVLSIADRIPEEGMKISVEMNLTDSTAFKGSAITGRDGEFLFSVGDIKGYHNLTLMVDSICSNDSVQPVHRRITLDRQFTPVARDIFPDEPEFLFEFQARMVEPALDTSKTERQIERLQKLKEIVVKGKKLIPDIVYEVDREVNYFLDLGGDLPYSTFPGYMVYRNEDFEYKSSELAITASQAIAQIYSGQNRSVDYLPPPRPVLTHKKYKYLATGFSCRGIWDGYCDKIPVYREEMDSIRRIEEFSEIVFSINGHGSRYFHSKYPNKYHSKTVFVVLIPHEVPFYPDQGIRQTNLEGYAVATEFFVRDYQTSPLIPGETDERRTLRWLPNMETDSSGTLSIDYYKNSSGKAANISVEGFTKKGGVLCGYK
jgi:hypothetical protein